MKTKYESSAYFNNECLDPDPVKKNSHVSDFNK